MIDRYAWLHNQLITDPWHGQHFNAPPDTIATKVATCPLCEPSSIWHPGAAVEKQQQAEQKP